MSDNTPDFQGILDGLMRRVGLDPAEMRAYAEGLEALPQPPCKLEGVGLELGASRAHAEPPRDGSAQRVREE